MTADTRHLMLEGDMVYRKVFCSVDGWVDSTLLGPVDATSTEDRCFELGLQHEWAELVEGWGSGDAERAEVLGTYRRAQWG